MDDDENDGKKTEPSVHRRDHLLPQSQSQSHRTGDEAIECDYEVLPVVDYKEEILTAVRNHQIVIVIGETGSGKTTQIPQFFLDAPNLVKSNQRIGVTQPRRIAAITIAQRVSDERSTRLGQEIGYTVRFDDCTADSTRVKYMTDGILVRECLTDKYLANYDIIMLDEAHERSLNTDVLFGLLKATCKLRPDLKLVITSATLETSKFSEYFMHCPIIRVPGRVFDVHVYHSKTKQIMTATGPANNAYVQAAVDVILQIHRKDTEGGHILVFLTGQEEIERACHLLGEAIRSEQRDHKAAAVMSSHKELIVMPLYAALSTAAQAKIFKKPSSLLTRTTASTTTTTASGPTMLLRKCVIATNIAETSVTVPQVRFVVDAGYVKQKTFDPMRGMESLVVVPISKTAALQRSGRAGRTGPGQCYRLYSLECFDNMMEETIPEIKRINLANTVLYLKALGIHDVLGFDFLDPPSEDQIMQALSQLHTLGAIDDEGVITPLGRSISLLPLEPHLGRILIESFKHDCLSEVTTICAMQSSENIWVRPSRPGGGGGGDKRNKPPASSSSSSSSSSGIGQQEHSRIQLNINSNHFVSNAGFLSTGDSSGSNEFARAEQAHQQLRHPYGDFHTCLSVYQEWERNGFTQKWCDRNYINHRAMKSVKSIRDHLERDALKILSGPTATTATSGMAESRGEHHRQDTSQLQLQLRPLDKRISTVVTTGFYMNSSTRCVNESVYKSLSLLDVQRQLKHQSALDVRMVHIHPSSALAAMPGPEHLLYMQLAYTNKLYMQQVCRADSKLLKRLQSEWKYVDPYVLCGRELDGGDQQKQQHSRRCVESKDDANTTATASAIAPDKGGVVVEQHCHIGVKRPLPLDSYSYRTVASEIKPASNTDPTIAAVHISNGTSGVINNNAQQTINSSVANAFLAKQRYLERKGAVGR